MRNSSCLNLTLPMTERVELLLEDYDFFVKNPQHFCERLDVLSEIRGKVVVNAWKEQVLGGSLRLVVQDLLLAHYDPVYVQSMQRNFRQFESATGIAPIDHSMASMMDLARTLL